MSEPDKKLPGGMLQNLDQMSGLLSNIADLMALYYKELKEKGVPEELAQVLVIDYQKTILRGPQR